MKKLSATILSLTLIFAMTCPVFAIGVPSELDAAAAQLQEQGIMVGDQNGDMHLDSGLSRAELAAILTRLHGGSTVNPEHYTWACYFTDVPQWAKSYVGYCTANLLVAGYGDLRYGANDPVTPQMACTVILRAFGHEDGEGSTWDYGTACSYAVSLGLMDQASTQSDNFTRGDMAILIYRAQQKQDTQSPAQQLPQGDSLTTSPDGSITEKIITQVSWSREDFSQNANPAIFTGHYTRSWYNAIRQSVVDRDAILSGNDVDDLNHDYLYAYTLVPDQPSEAFDSFSDVLDRITGKCFYKLGAESYVKNQYEYPGYAIIKPYQPQALKDALSYVQPMLEQLAGNPPVDQVIAINDYVCDRLEYQTGASAGLDDIFSAGASPAYGECGAYTIAFQFLCDEAGIPCVSILSENHSWNQVYVDGRWLTVDTTFNDASAGRNHYLLTEQNPRADRCPEGTLFAKELLVPGSTK